MDDDDAAELARLRERAYGPDADIAGDPAAIDRLRQLESPAVAPAEQVPDAAVPAPSAAAPTPEPEPEPEPEPDPVPVSWRRRHRIPLLWATSLVVVGLLTAAVAFTVASMRSVDVAGGNQQVATLALDRTIDTPNFLGSGRGKTDVFEDFEGLTPLTSPSRRTDQLDVCFVVLRTDSVDFTADFLTGPAFSACGTETFPVSVSLRVTNELPESIRDRFPDGTALQFVLHDDVVRVFAGPARTG
jgi:hypothetical protein